MEVTIVRKQRLVDVCNVEDIVSILEVESAFGKSLAIALKSDNLRLRSYGDHTRGGAVFISLDRFTYHIPRYVALPREQYENVIITEKKGIESGVDEYGEPWSNSIRFIKASIVKKVVW